jgi:hypothetical protein
MASSDTLTTRRTDDGPAPEGTVRGPGGELLYEADAPKSLTITPDGDVITDGNDDPTMPDDADRGLELAAWGGLLAAVAALVGGGYALALLVCVRVGAWYVIRSDPIVAGATVAVAAGVGALAVGLGMAALEGNRD